MRPATTRRRLPDTPYVTFELGNSGWKLAMTTSMEQVALVRTVPARALARLDAEICSPSSRLEVRCALRRLCATPSGVREKCGLRDPDGKGITFYRDQ